MMRRRNDSEYTEDIPVGEVIDWVGLLLKMRAIRDENSDPVWVEGCNACIQALLAEVGMGKEGAQP